MRKVYSGIGWVVAFLVVVQAGAIAVGFGGMMHFVDGGGVVDKALTESRTLGNFTGELGFPVHGLVGGLLLPLLALVQLIVSWFTKVRRVVVGGGPVPAHPDSGHDRVLHQGPALPGGAPRRQRVRRARRRRRRCPAAARGGTGDRLNLGRRACPSLSGRSVRHLRQHASPR